MLEDAYVEALCEELLLRGVSVGREVLIQVVYKGNRLRKTYKIDVLVADLVIVEAKAVEQLHPTAFSQCLTHLRLTGKKLGIVINFGEKYVKDGVHRVVNGL